MKAYLILLLNITLISCALKAQQPSNITLQLKWKHQFQFAPLARACSACVIPARTRL